MARVVVAGNWKMNLGPREAARFMEGLSLPQRGSVEVIFFPPTLSMAVLQSARQREELSHIGLGVQNIHHEDSGAFTGEISASMAQEAGAEFVLVGHSERRHLFGETDAETRMKVEAAFRHGLTPVLCVGETLDERRAGQLSDVLLRQLDEVLAPRAIRERLEGNDRFLLAYEPVWAIGTGETATPDDASQAHAILRDRLEQRLGSDRAGEISILYGGSVKPSNAGELLEAPDVNGVLVGGASLDPDSFARIAAATG